MASTVDSVVRAPAPFRAQSPAELAAVPWYVWSLFAAVVSVVIGGYWDISWHMSIGRDEARRQGRRGFGEEAAVEVVALGQQIARRVESDMEIGDVAHFLNAQLLHRWGEDWFLVLDGEELESQADGK